MPPRDSGSRWTRHLIRTFGFRLGLWYFALFIAGTALVLALAYALLASSLRARDRAAIEATLVRYGGAYERGGLAELGSVVNRDRFSASYEPLFVRITGDGDSAIFFSLPSGWDAFDVGSLSNALPRQRWTELSTAGSDERLEVASARLPSGPILQVGRSTANRQALLSIFRESALLIFGMVLLAGLAGGAAITWSALGPLRELNRTVLTILRTGSTTARIAVRDSGDPLDELGILLNRLLDRIDRLMTAMRGSLDNVAHDLRTPVTRLRAMAETALQRSRPAEEYRAALADCLEQSDRIVTVLDALLDIAEAETGTMQLRIERFDLVPLLRAILDLYDELAVAKPLSLELDVPDTLSVIADRGRLNQAITNLVDNAVKYTPPGGRIVVSARTTGSTTEIGVSDSGPGIPPDELPRIWERLYRGDRSRSTRGFGLGLSLVKAIVEAHGGRVWAASTPGEGSLFTVELPAAANMT
jgi:signal transduction histidine kinase